MPERFCYLYGVPGRNVLFYVLCLYCTLQTESYILRYSKAILKRLNPVPKKNYHPWNIQFRTLTHVKCNYYKSFKILQRFSPQSPTQVIDPIGHLTSSCVRGPSL